MWVETAMTPKQIRQRRAAIEGYAGIRPRHRKAVDESIPDRTRDEAESRRVARRATADVEPTLIGFSSDEGTNGVRLIAWEAKHQLLT